MEQLTVRRWVAAPPGTVWGYLLDLQGFVEADHALDLEDLLGDLGPDAAPGRWARATITRRVGARVERLTLRVEERAEPERLTVRIDAGGERWSLTVTLVPLPGDGGCGTDVRFHLDRDPASGHRFATGRAHRTAQHLGALLEGLARRLDAAPRQLAGAGC